MKINSILISYTIDTQCKEITGTLQEYLRFFSGLIRDRPMTICSLSFIFSEKFLYKTE